MQCFQSLTSMLRLIYCAHFASLSYSSTSLHGVTSVPVSSCVLPLNINFFKPPKRLQYHKAGKFFFTQHIKLLNVFDKFPKNYV